MSAQYSSAQYSQNSYHAVPASTLASRFVVSAEDRIGSPRAGRLGRFARRLVLLGLIGFSGWVYADEERSWTAWLRTQTVSAASTLSTAVTSAVAALIERSRQMPTGQPPVQPGADAVNAGEAMVLGTPGTAPPLPPPAGPQDRVVPAVAVGPAPAEITTTAAPATAAAITTGSTQAAGPVAGTDTHPPQPYAPPALPKAGPLQARAEAAGLHPGLSPVLLERLTATDFRNAGAAVRTALADTPDSAVLVWPRQRTPELAVFQVRFVQGAAPDCRRYVVTIYKDGWSTTAQPMEKCGSKAKSARRDG